MDVTAELTRLSGLQQLQAIFAGKTGYAGIVKTLDLHPVSAEEGFVVFEGSPTQAVYNPTRLGAWRLCGYLARYRWPGGHLGLLFSAVDLSQRVRR